VDRWIDADGLSMECADGLMMVGELGASTDDAGQDEHQGSI
jgi:hypothetical protein